MDPYLISVFRRVTDQQRRCAAGLPPTLSANALPVPVIKHPPRHLASHDGGPWQDERTPCRPGGDRARFPRTGLAIHPINGCRRRSSSRCLTHKQLLEIRGSNPALASLPSSHSRCSMLTWAPPRHHPPASASMQDSSPVTHNMEVRPVMARIARSGVAP
jgi:hypothetical protein